MGLKVSVKEIRVWNGQDEAVLECGHVVPLGEHDPSNESLVSSEKITVCEESHK
jgi:hypothetical protein